MNSILSSSIDSSLLAKNGFLRKKMLDEDQVKVLRALYAQYFPNGTEKFYSSTFLQDVNLKQEINKQLCDLLLPTIEKHFENYKVLGAQFLIKNKGDGGKMPWHQDWTIVDETNYRSVTVWIGLQDIDETNGAIKVVPGSHEFSRGLRGPGNYDALANIQPLLEGYAHTLIMPAGEAFIFDHSLIHSSGLNTIGQPRIAVALGLVHKSAPLNFYHRSNSNFEHYSVPDDFFITFPNTGKAPEGATLQAVITHPFEKITAEHFIERMKTLSHTPVTASAIQPLFKDKALQQKFDEDGYVKISLLSTEQADDLKAYYLSLKHDHIGEYGFHISLENKNADYINGVFKKLFETALPELDGILDNYKAFTASYVIKEAGLQNIVPPHQDWTFVNEDEFSSATVWIPLMDVNKNNGALGVIKGSHRVFNYPRSSPSPQSKSLLSDHAFNLFPYVEVIDMKAGEALVFNNRTVHASPPNISGITRIAAGIGITQKNAQLLHLYQLPGAEENIAVYDVDESFFMNHNNSKMSAHYNKGEEPGGLKKTATFKKATPVLSKQEITGKVESIKGVQINTTLMAELAGLYNYNTDGTPKTKTEMSNTNEKNQGANNTAKNVMSTDTRSFFQKYTPANIIAEIKYRLKKA